MTSREERLKAKGQRYKEKRERFRQEKLEKQSRPEYKAKQEEKKRAELAALHNIKNETPKQNKVRNKFKKSSGRSVGMSKENKKWEQKRKEHYNSRVWRGWRGSDGVEYPVTVKRLEDIENDKS